MPYLDSKIETNQHKNDCSNPIGKRLYIRDYNDKGKSCFIPWGLTCTTCDVVIKDENFQQNLPPRQKERKESFESFGDKDLFEHVNSVKSGINLRDCDEKASHQSPQKKRVLEQ